MFTLLALRNEGIAASPAPSLFPPSVNSVSLCLALFFRPSTSQTRGGTSPRYRPTLNHPLKRYSTILPLSVGCQLSAVSSLSPSPFPATVTGSSQLIENPATLSPAFATLTSHVNPNPFVCHSYRKTPGVGYPRRASHLFVFSPFNTKLPALSGVEGSTACPVYPELRREPSRRVDRLSGLLCLPLSPISLPTFPFAASCTRLPSRTAAPSSSRTVPAQTANRNCSSKFPTPLPRPASPYYVSICRSAPSARMGRLRRAAPQRTATVCGARLPS
jgi:hypothetical protein